MSLREEIIEKMRRKYKQMTAGEQSVTRLLVAAKKPITQAVIARTEMFLGTHEKHEHLSLETSTRRVRQLVHDLKVKHGIIIVSGKQGYKIPDSLEEVEEFLDKMEAQTTSTAISYRTTLKATRQSLSGLRERKPLFALLDEEEKTI